MAKEIVEKYGLKGTLAEEIIESIFRSKRERRVKKLAEAELPEVLPILKEMVGKGIYESLDEAIAEWKARRARR